MIYTQQPENKYGFFLILFLLICNTDLRGQENKFVYKLSNKIEELKDDSKPILFQRKAWEYSFIGNLKQSLASWDSVRRIRFDKFTKNDSLSLSTARLESAVRYIDSISKNKQIIIINEAHHIPYHRLFTKSLLKSLFENGFTYLGVEDYSFKSDTLLNKRGYATIKSGYYLREVFYADMVRKAKELNYTVFGYDDDDWDYSEREYKQAQLISRILEKDRNAKIVIHCGFDHAREDTTAFNNKKAMAYWLKQITNIDPLTVDQTVYLEKSSDAYTHPLNIKFSETITIPSVILTSNNESFHQELSKVKYDLSVIHPKSLTLNERPLWQFNQKFKYYIDHSIVKISYPILVAAYRFGEEIVEGIPVDIIEFKSSMINHLHLLLEKGKYHLMGFNGQQEQSLGVISVDSSNKPHTLVDDTLTENTYSAPQIQNMKDFFINNKLDTIISINLDNLGLIRLPKEILKCKNLKTLSLKNNQLKAIPIKLLNFKYLEVLDMSGNPLNCKKINFKKKRVIRILRLSDCSLKEIPKTLAKLSSLDELTLSNNGLTDNLEIISKLKQLRTLSLYNNKISDLPNKFINLQHLESIDLYHNDIKSFPKVLLELKKLHTLAVSYNNIDSLPFGINTLKNLKKLYINHNDITYLPTDLSGLNSLKILDLSYNKLVDLKRIIMPRNLVSLDLSNNLISSLPEGIMELTNLQFLSIKNSSLPIESCLELRRIMGVYKCEVAF